MRYEQANDFRRWRQFIFATLLLLCGIGYVYRDTAMSMVLIWIRSETFTHGFLVLPIVVWLVWRKRALLLSIEPRSDPRGLLVVSILSVLWILGNAAGANSIVQLAFVGMLVAATVSVIGWRAAKIIAFPLGFLFFAVPLGEFLLPLLMERTADFTVAALKLSGIPVHREGLQFVIPSGNWSVVEACSGVRYLIASLTIGTLFAYLNYRTMRRRWLFVGVSILVPIVANWVRAYLIVMLGHLSGNELATGVDHLVYGWAFFGVVIVAMFVIGARWSESVAPLPPISVVSSRSRSGSRDRLLWVVVGAAFLLGTVPRFLDAAQSRALSGSASPRLVKPDLEPRWRSGTTSISDWEPVFSAPSAKVVGAYERGVKTVGVSIVYYRDLSYNRKLISSSNTLLRSDNPLWRKVQEEQREVNCANRTFNVRAFELRDLRISDQMPKSILTVWQYYWIGGSVTINGPLAILLGAYYKLVGRGDDSASVVIYSSDPHPEESIEAFLSDNCELIDAELRRVRDAK